MPVDKGGIGSVPFSVAEPFPLSPQRHLDSFSSKCNGALIGFIGNACAQPTRTNEKDLLSGVMKKRQNKTKINDPTAEWRPKTVKVTSRAPLLSSRAKMIPLYFGQRLVC